MHKKIINFTVLVLFLILVIFITSDTLNRIANNSMFFDGAYNAQVAANFSRSGSYAVSYPDNICIL